MFSIYTLSDLGVPVFKATNFRGINVDCRLAAPISTDFMRGISAEKLDSFRLE